MAEKKEIILIGGGGHAKVVIDAIRESGEFIPCGIVDKSLKKGSPVSGVTVIGDDNLLPEIFKRGVDHAFICVGSIGDCSGRKRIYEKLKAIGFTLPVIKHPQAIISKEVSFGEGVFVAARTVINPGTSIGVNTIINTASSVDHDCSIGDFVHIAPGVVLSGEVKVGSETHIGTGASVIQSINIGKKCMVGAGVTVRHNSPDNTKEFGKLYDIHVAGRKKRIFIIAEAGVNHNGDINMAKKLIDKASKAGADAIKFQTFKAENMVTRRAPKAVYQKVSTSRSESQLDMIKRLELSPDAHRELLERCKKRGIIFLSSPFDIESVELLDSLGLESYKIPSGEITNLPYLRRIGQSGKKIILSSGMADLRDIEQALDILVQAGTAKDNITVLHCNTEYPTSFEDANLTAMLTIRDTCKVDTGYSDHTLGLEAPIAAAALGASVIEKHFTLSRRMKGPDHKASLEPDELTAMVKAIRNVEKLLGSGAKKPTASEYKNIAVVRKSIVASGSIKKGEIFSENNITTKRPGTGISPMEWDTVIGMSAKRDYKKDESITL